MTPTHALNGQTAYDQFWSAVEGPRRSAAPTGTVDAYAEFDTALDGLGAGAAPDDRAAGWSNEARPC